MVSSQVLYSYKKSIQWKKNGLFKPRRVLPHKYSIAHRFFVNHPPTRVEKLIYLSNGKSR